MRSDSRLHHVPHHHNSTLRDYLRVARRRKWIILQAVVLVPLAAVLFSMRQEKQYRASAEVLLSQQNLASALTGTPTPAQFTAPDRVAQTQADLARVPEVAQRTLTAVRLRRSPLDLLNHSSVSAQQNADLLEFSVTDHDPDLAVRLATAYADAYTKYREELDTASLVKARTEVQQRMLGVDHRSGLYTNLAAKDQELATMEALQTSNASLVKPAGGAVQVQPRPVRNGILGLALGLVLGIGLAFLWEALDTRVRSPEEIAEHLGLPLLARLPAPPKRLSKDDRLVMFAEPRGDGSEPFRMLRTNLEFVRLGHDVRTIMITSAVEQEGKSTTTANLAVALARAGQRVALVDLDLRRPFLNRFFDLRRRPGLTQVAIGQAGLDDALIAVPLGDTAEERARAQAGGNARATARQPYLPALNGGGLRVLAAGPVPPNAGELVSSDVVAEILAELRRRFDTVLLDAPPLLQVGDAMALTRSVDGVMVVARMNVVRRPMLNEVRRLLETCPAAKLGFVLADAQSDDGYGYGGGYHYYGSHPSAQVHAT